MDMKVLIILVTIMVTIADCEGKAALRRKPKVYNALITTDEDLVQSRAYPVIQPTIHESGIAHYPYGPYNPYGLYNPHVVRLAQPIAPALTPKEQLPYPLPPPSQFPPQFMRQPLIPQPQPLPVYGLPQNTPTSPAAEKPQESSIPPKDVEKQPQPEIQPPTVMTKAAPAELPEDPNQPSKMPSEQLPIPLNQYGLPPSLIPLRQPYRPHPIPNGPQPYYLPPYSFNQFPPLYYNSLPALRQPLLPPYDYLPTGPQFPLSNTIPTDKTYPPQPPSPPLPLPSTASPTPPTSPSLGEQPIESSLSTTDANEQSFENIKNGSKSKDSNVPDVPPPPIPSRVKSNQS